MAKQKPTRALQKYVLMAKKDGYPVTGGVNGGGWMNLATTCGCDPNCSRNSAIPFMQKKYGVLQDYEPQSKSVRKAKSSLASARKRSGLTKDTSPDPIQTKFKGQSTEETVKTFVKHYSTIDPTSDNFLSSFEWKAIRMMALKQHGAVCQCCGASPKTGAVVNVDHIKPRKHYPALALSIDNLQVLCGDCNQGKGNWDQTDWRKSPGIAMPKYEISHE